MISSSEFATDDDGEDCWRVQAALAQQLPVLLRTMVSVSWQFSHA